MESATPKKTIALDLDGVLHHVTNGWHLRPDVMTDPVPDDIPVPGAQDFCRWLITRGYTPIVFSARLHAGGYLSGLAPIRNWLEQHDFPWMEIALSKPQAVLYLDDKGFRFEGDFDEVQQFIEQDLERGQDTWVKTEYDARQLPGIHVGDRVDYRGTKRFRVRLGKPSRHVLGCPQWYASRQSLMQLRPEAMQALLSTGLIIIDYDANLDVFILQHPPTENLGSFAVEDDDHAAMTGIPREDCSECNARPQP